MSVQITEPSDRPRPTRRLVRRGLEDITARELEQFRNTFRRLVASEDSAYYEVVGVYGLPLPMYSQHGTRLFLAWNRAHLRMFEEVLAAQEIRFGIPWWDWTSAVSRESGVPAAFAEERIDGELNPLNESPFPPAARNENGEPTTTSRAPGQPRDLPTAENVQAVLQLSDFNDFQAQLEQIHNQVHVWVGGSMGTITTSAYDPLFWPLQANIDRLWRVWQINHPTARLASELLKQALPPFSLTVADVLDVESLGYDYELSDDLPGLLVGPAGARNDRPSAWGGLGFDEYVDAFARLIESAATEPPITIGIYGTWGMGKSSLLGQIAARFERSGQESPEPSGVLRNVVRRLRWSSTTDEQRQEDTRRRVHVVFFNAWDYNASEAIWPALVRKTMDCLERRVPLPWPRKMWHRLVRNGRREWRRRRTQVFAAAVVAAPLAVLAVVHLDFSLTEVSAVIAALGIAGALNFIRKAVSNPLSRWLAGVLEDADYGRQTDLMTQIRDDLNDLDARLGDDRILIIIDDLDRCEPGKAVELLQALNLLLEGRSFVVCLGIDARIVTQAIEAHYKGLLGEAGASGYEYLDKIIHIPFSIPEPTAENIQDFFREEIPTLVRPIIRPDAQPVGGSIDAAEAASHTYDTSGALPTTSGRDEDREHWETEVPFSEDELQAFLGIARYLRRNPRHVKRLINVYRLVRTLAQRFAEPLILKQRKGVLEWLVISAQWPYAAHVMTHQFETMSEGERSAIDAQGSGLYRALFKLAEPALASEDARDLDDAHEVLKVFLGSTTRVTATEFAAITRYTINFNPAVAERPIAEIASAKARADSFDRNEVPLRPALVGLIGRLPGLSVTDAARLLETPREKVARAARDLKRQGLIEVRDDALSLARTKSPR